METNITQTVPYTSRTRESTRIATTQLSQLIPFDQLYIRHPKRWMVVILFNYLLIGSLFAIYTPAWQAPDEPAHYNNIAHIASGQGLPILQMGDYDQEYLAQIIGDGFPPEQSITSLRYESYQPPLYYLISAPIFLLSGGHLIALRLYNLFLGALAIFVLFTCLHYLFPQRALVSLSATAFAAFLPMHIAMLAAVNNDGLAELLTFSSLLVLLHWMRAEFYENTQTKREGRNHRSNEFKKEQRIRLTILSVLIALGLLTKIYAYALLPVCLFAIGMVSLVRPCIDQAWQRPLKWKFFGRATKRILWVILPALLLGGLPLWVRNAMLYGNWDLLGLNWHDQVVIGQPLTVEWIARFGWLSYIERALDFTFKSFWGVFGWMGIFMDNRIYMALLLFTGVLFMGWLWAVVRLASGLPDTDMDAFQHWVLALFSLMIVVVFAAYVWYNLKFVQHQGRYFFWGLMPISTLVAMGWRENLRPVQGSVTGLMAAVLAFALLLTDYLSRSYVGNLLNQWTLLSIALVALFLLLQPLLLAGTDSGILMWLPKPINQLLGRPPIANLLRGLRFLAWATPFILLAILDLWSLYAYILPQLN